MPSVEIFLHAICLAEGGASWVGHTHTASVNQVLCSRLGAEPFMKHLFPDAIVVCGVAPAVIPYVDPGFVLGMTVRDELSRYREAHGRQPKMLLMVNHGVVALGQTAYRGAQYHAHGRQVGQSPDWHLRAGGPELPLDARRERIDSRLDEHYRRGRLTRQDS